MSDTPINFNFTAQGADRVLKTWADLNNAMKANEIQTASVNRAVRELVAGNDAYIKQRLAQAITQQGSAVKNLTAEYAKLKAAAQKIEDPNERKRAIAAINQQVAAAKTLVQAQQQQATAARAKAAADKAAAVEADKLFQTNARLTQQKLKEELQAQAKAATDLQQGFQLLSKGASDFAGAIGGIFANATQEFLQYEQAVKQAGVISGSLGTENFTALTDEIRQLGIETTKTPIEIAKVSVQLSRAGFQATETSAALEGIVKASEATAEGLEVTGDIISKTIRSFQLAAEDSLAVSDALVATANNTNTSISGLGESLKFIAPAAVANNQSLEDTLIILGLLGDAGLQGGNAGRNLASALRQISIASAASESELKGLVRGSARAAEALKVIGVTARNSDGTLRPLTEIFPEIGSQLDNLSKADQAILIQALFGTEGGRVATNLINVLRETPERLDLVSDAVNNAGGVSERASEQLRGGLSGALNLLGGSLATVNNTIGQFVAAGLEPLVRAAVTVVNGFLALPAPIQNALIGFTGFVGILSAAVAAIAAYNAANVTLLTQQVALALAVAKQTLSIAANTLAKNVNTLATTRLNASELAANALRRLSAALSASQAAAQTAYAIATGKADAATRAQAQSLVTATASARAFALQLAAFAGAAFAIAAVGAAINDVGTIAQQNQEAVKNLREAVREYNEELALSDDAAEEGLSGLAKVAADNEEAIRNSISGVSKVVDALIRVFDLISDFDLGDYLTIEDRAVIEAQSQFFDVVGTIEGDVIPAFEALRDAPGGLAAASEEELGRFKELLEQSTTELKNSTVTTENDLKVKGQYQGVLGEISDALDGNTTATATDTEALEENTQAVDDNLQAQRDRAKELLNQQFANNQRGAEQDFGDTARAGEQAFADQARAEEQAFQDEQRRLEADFNAQQQVLEDGFNRAQEQRETAFAAQIEAREAAFNDREQSAQDSFARSQQQRQEQFNQRQRDAEAAFQSDLEARRQAAQNRFNARQQDIDRRVQLRFAEDPEARRQLEEQFEQQDREANFRRRLEADLIADQRAFEEQLRQEEEQFRLQQQSETQAFEKQIQAEALAFEQQLAAARQVFEDQIQAETLAFEQSQQNLDRAFQAEQQARQTAFEDANRQAERAFQDSQRNEERAFQDGQREAERAFQDSQRREEAAFKERERGLDVASAEQIALIIRNARAQQLEEQRDRNGDGEPRSLRVGGSFEAGEPLRLHKDEFVVPTFNGTVLSQQRSRAVVREALTPAIPQAIAPRVSAVPISKGDSSTLLKGILQEQMKTRQMLKGIGRPSRSVTFNGRQPEGDDYHRLINLIGRL